MDKRPYTRRRYVPDQNKTRPVLHMVTCKQCGELFQERSDPRAEFGFCPKCKPAMVVGTRPLNPDWWEAFWTEHEDIDPLQGKGGTSGK